MSLWKKKINVQWPLCKEKENKGQWIETWTLIHRYNSCFDSWVCDRYTCQDFFYGSPVRPDDTKIMKILFQQEGHILYTLYWQARVKQKRSRLVHHVFQLIWAKQSSVKGPEMFCISTSLLGSLAKYLQLQERKKRMWRASLTRPLWNPIKMYYNALSQLGHCHLEVVSSFPGLQYPRLDCFPIHCYEAKTTGRTKKAARKESSAL